MKFNTKLTTLAAAVSLTTLLVACGGGGGTSTAGIGGSGITSSGTITGFGSVFVNGVKFETTGSSFDIEGKIGSQSNLAIGMVVQVNGTINPDGVTGTATSIVFDDDLQGPVANFTLVPDALNPTGATFTVMGINVEVDSKTTYFDRDNIELGVVFDITTIQTGNMVELSGFFNGTGSLIATRIESKENADPEDRNKVEIKGTITNLDIALNTFTLTNTFTAGITVNTSSIDISSFQNGDLVEVEGTFDSATQIITARKIESEEFDYGDSDELEMEGYITDFTSHSNFKVNGIPVDASDAVFEPSNIQLDDDLQVEVEGRFLNGVLIAEEIKMRGGDVEVSAFITHVDPTNNRFEVTPVSGQPPIVIHTGAETQFENDITDSYSVRISDLRVGQFVEVEGYLNDNGSIFGSEVEITDPDDIELQGIVETFILDAITILGITVNTVPTPSFEGDNTITSLTELKNEVTNGKQVLIKIKVNPNTGVATEIEIED